MGPLDPSRLGAFLMRQIPPSDGEVVERGNVLPLGTYRTPDGRETTTLAFPQPMREGLDALAYALGYRQDPNAPAGYVTHDALNKGGQGLAESAMVGSIGARAPSGALRSGMAKPDLDPSLAARRARSLQQGWGDETLYHGTLKGDFDAFNPSKAGSATQAASAREGTWLSSSPDTASGYANLAADQQVQRLIDASQRAERQGQWDKANDLMRQAEELEQSGVTGAAVMPLRVRGKIKEVDMDGVQYDPDDVNLSELVRQAKEEGFQGLRLRNFSDEAGYGVYNPTDHVVMFDPKNIRSVNAMFDPAKSDSANLLAANPMAGAVPLAWRQPQEQQQGPMMGEQMGRRIPPEEEAQRQALIRYLQGVQ